MERYITEKSSTYSRNTLQILFPLYGLIFLTSVSLLGQAVGEISSGRNLSGEYAPLSAREVIMILFIIAFTSAVGYLIFYMKREQVCGDLTPRLARFAAMSTNEYVPMRTIAQILRVKPDKAAAAVKEMMKRKYIRNLEITPDGKQLRILQYHKITVFEVYCKNCGARYTQTSEDDLICQYCGHPVEKV